jgi:hypothetical protein
VQQIAVYSITSSARASSVLAEDEDSVGVGDAGKSLGRAPRMLS